MLDFRLRPLPYTGKGYEKVELCRRKAATLSMTEAQFPAAAVFPAHLNPLALADNIGAGFG
jgi:hypothetical protein